MPAVDVRSFEATTNVTLLTTCYDTSNDRYLGDVLRSYGAHIVLLTTTLEL